MFDYYIGVTFYDNTEDIYYVQALTDYTALCALEKQLKTLGFWEESVKIRLVKKLKKI